MAGLASNLCILGMGYVITVAVHAFKRWAIAEQERDERRRL